MRRLVRGLKVIALASASAGIACALVAAGWVLMPLPEEMLTRPATGLRIEDRHGMVLRSTRAADGSRARWTPLAEMDPDLLLAFTAVEDKRFWSHAGVDPLAVGRSLVANRRAGRVVTGASTITMQLVRLLAPGPRGWRGKLRETAWAIRIDWHLPKDAILEQYLNRVHLGQGAVGVTAATTLYFGATAGEVSVGEAAMLAGLAHAPSRDNPMADPAAARRRRRVALARMRRAAMIAPGEERLADAEPLLPPRARAPFLAPHFTTRLVRLDERLARAGAPADRTWRATLDAALQAEVEAEVRHAVDVLRARNVRHAAVVVLDNPSGDVLAWVGSPDFWESRTGQTDMVTSARQPGSALKPFLYALAFDRGTTAATVLPDVPRSFATATGAYTPRNYDRRYRGPVRVREALASSYNVPAVALAERIGVGALHATLRRAGFASLDREPDHYGLGLALGNGDVTLIELANGYRALANGGAWRPWRWLESGPDDALARLTPAATEGEARVVSREAAALVLDVLADPVARAPGFGLQTPFDFPFRVAVKTGTSRHFTDNWAIATTERFTVAVWVGNFSGQPMQGVSGISGAGPLLNRAVHVTAQRYAPGELVSPGALGLLPRDVCRVSGKLATAACPGMREWFLAGNAPTERDDWVRDGRVRLPAEYAEWTASAPRGYMLDDDEEAALEVPTEDQVVEPVTTRGTTVIPVPTGFRVVSPADGDVLRVPPGVPARYATIALQAVGAPGPVRWFVNGRAFEGARWPLEAGDYVIRAEGAGGLRAEARVKVQ